MARVNLSKLMKKFDTKIQLKSGLFVGNQCYDLGKFSNKSFFGSTLERPDFCKNSGYKKYVYIHNLTGQ